MKLLSTTQFRGMLLISSVFLVIALCMATAMPNLAIGQDKKETEKAEVRKMSQDTLARLYKAQPSARKAVEGGAGYAVFSNFGMKIGFAGGGSGKGVAYNNKTKKGPS